MESSSGGRCGEIASDLAIIVVTVAQLIFFVFFHRYIAWYITAPGGSVFRLSMLTENYFTWLLFPIVASVVVVVATIVMIIYDNCRFRQIAWIVFCILGIAVVVSLVVIFPFDFSVIPNATAAEVAPVVVTAFFVLMAVFYALCALVLFVRLRNRAVQDHLGGIQ